MKNIICICMLLNTVLFALENQTGRYDKDLKQDEKQCNKKQNKLLRINQTFKNNIHNVSLAIAGDFSSRGFSGLSAFGVHYKQPNTFFRLQGRMSLELEGFLGAKPYNSLNQIIVGVAQDITLPLFKDGIYAGVGIGIYIRTKLDERMDSAFSFGEKVFIGYRHDLMGGGD